EKAEDWKGLASFFDDPELEPGLSIYIRLVLGIAQCRSGNFLQGVRVACRAVSEFAPEDFDSESNYRKVFQYVLNDAIGAIAKKDRSLIASPTLDDDFKSLRLEVARLADQPEEAARLKE